MGRGRDLAALSAKGAKSTAQRLGVDGWLGVPIGITVAGRRWLYGSPEDMHVDVWGPRTGKTTSRAIPAILSAPGAVIVTSNKRDVLDATREVRAQKGTVWAFDPQGIALEAPSWWWNPLSYVTDEEQAAKLANHFASGSARGRCPRGCVLRPCRAGSPCRASTGGRARQSADHSGVHLDHPAQ
ncbi:type IV secretory pathway TraG/TraD family ATPase (plasmid) [Leifsonia sp. P73]|uniref:type IV secretory system conjugative DNA transfer family protein n=1 Tax=unclassified Leifsonia TaxID=2663824 RepID=UPI003703776D